MCPALPSPDLLTMIASLEAITGDLITFQTVGAEPRESEHSWDVLSSSGQLHGILRIRPEGRSLNSHQHRLYSSLSQIIADHIDLLGQHSELKERYEKAGQEYEELVRDNERLRETAFEDTVTGLYRRSYLHEQLQLEISRAQRYGRKFAILLADVDHFKQINDKWGHQAGDVALKHLSRLMKQSSRTTDIVSRLGGDEFGLLLTDTDLQGGIEVATRVLKRCGTSPVRWNDVSFHISVSIGLGAFEHDCLHDKIDSEVLLDHVDRALYRSKGDGRARLTIAPPLISSNTDDRA